MHIRESERAREEGIYKERERKERFVDRIVIQVLDIHYMTLYFS